MVSASAESVRVVVEGTSDGHGTLRAWGGRYAIGRVPTNTIVGSGDPLGVFETPEPARVGADLQVPRAAVHLLEGSLDAAVGLLVPPLAATLRMWDDLGLELGELAVVTDGHPLSRLTALVASWHAARAILVTQGTAEPMEGVAIVRLHDQAEPIAFLMSVFQESVAATVVEFSGAADVVDALLESVPSSSRLLFASQDPERLTIDFYRNVHRKGLELLSGVAGPAMAFRDTDADRQRRLFVRACRLLADPRRAQACAAALAPTGR